ncbi:bromodomain-containing protein homolog [Lutzomyia longipalpis]|uniref:bromodomain-containing protein homolog n=1 Tax=Lutzomyia longipalpis TaxID=7200 RepID=UPI0024836301|nr:bromodomain-containing protein homolog [Lutzomyia longipalpis]
METLKRAMGLDFNVVEYIKTIRANDQPPYKCPVEKCDKSYKSHVGMQYHLLNFDHETGMNIAPVATPSRKKGRTRVPGATPKQVSNEQVPPKEAVTYNEALGIVRIECEGHTLELRVNEDLPVMDMEEYRRLVEKGKCPAPVEVPPEPHIKLPEAAVKELKNYNICDAPPRPNAYIRFIEKSAEELDGEVEYDVDEEDTTWLSIINEKRASQGLTPVSVDSLELLMDRLEKESYFQAAANGQSGAVVDDDAVCSICLDGECQNTNVILFCDMCNLAVHQDCYGVPYIPEGQWLCRRCLQSPSRPVDCVLCPNKGGAFKQTDHGQWAHVVCALWIPEVRFANTVFLEPIDSIETIPAARWRLSCYICKQKSVGACIQCHRTNCYAAFHVTCAQQAGLHMRMDTVRDKVTGNEAQPIIVQKTAYCDAHAPAGSAETPEMEMSDKAREESRNKMKQARKLLAKKRTSVPVILIPTIPPERVQEIAQLVNIQKKSPFIQRLIAYWTLKRQYRNGVPLLRRLQSQGQSHSTFGVVRSGIEGSPDTSELYQQLKYWQSLRQDLERARLLCELVRKREKLKVALIKVQEQALMMQLNPVEAAMYKLLEGLEQKDTAEIFREPVDVNEVPDYMDIVKHPMDLSTMAMKLKSGAYESLDDMEADFDLMIRNCLAYNNKDTIFYRAGTRMRDQGGALFKGVRRDLEKEGLISVKKTDEIVGQEIDEELKGLLQLAPSEKTLTKLQILLERAVARHGLTKTKRVRQLKMEIAKMKRALAKKDAAAEREASPTPPKEPQTAHSGQKRDGQAAQTPPCSPLKAPNSSASPSGVNRRTAVLFTRKAQAALKKPDLPTKEDSSCDVPTVEKPKTPRKPGRKKGNSTRKSVDEKEKKSAPMASGSNPKKASPVKEAPFESIPDSFRVYRAQPKKDVPDSDESDMSFTHSTCSSCSGFMDDGSGSDFGSSFDDDTSYSESDGHSTDNEDGKAQREEKPATLEPLQLVWAKCTGYPWYPALIIDPQMPKDFIHNGVPLPVPPQDVLALRKNSTEHVFLVLFFDAKRTWQWLPANKLELLGLDKEVDQAKLMESRKPKERKAVKKAYQNALFYQSQVTEQDAGQPTKGRA